jgi:hypothetical protein
MTSEFIDNENENSIRNPLYSKQLQGHNWKKIKEITIQNNTTQDKQKLEQLEIENLLCNTSTNAYVIEVAILFEINKNI